MPDEKKRSKAVWWVLTEKDAGVLVKHYSGPDKKRARDVAAKLLADKESKVFVGKLSSLAVLAPSHLRASLPRDAF